MQKTIKIDNDKVYTMSIHPDYSRYTDFIQESFIKNLKDNQKVELNFESVGCFHAKGYTTTVSKKEGNYFLETRGVVKKLNKKEVAIIIKMECELNLLQPGGCTTKDHYTIKFGNNKKEYFDRTCAWKGWGNLFEKINLKI